MVKTTTGDKWREIKVGDETIFITPLDIKDEKYPDVTPNGEVLTKEFITHAQSKWLKQDGTEYNGETFKLIDNEVVQRTKATTQVDAKDITELDAKADGLHNDIVAEKEFLVRASEQLHKRTELLNRSLKFPFDTGAGYKNSLGVLFFDGQQKEVLLRVGRVRRSQIIEAIKQ